MISWIDITVAITGAVAALLGIWMGLRMMKPDDEEVEEKEIAPLSPPPPPVAPPKPVIEKAVSQPKPKAQPIAKVPASEPAVTVQMPAPAFKAPASDAELPSPFLKVLRIQRLAPGEIRLVLQNAGATLIFLELISAEFNEVEISYSPPIFREEERYVNGTSMHVSLKGKRLQDRTYHFSIRYLDLEGNQYKQEVAGMGVENPIVEEPVRVLGPVSEHET